MARYVLFLSLVGPLFAHAEGFTDNEKKAFLDAVNAERLRWGVNARVDWDNELSFYAQTWVESLRGGGLQVDPNLRTVDKRWGWTGQTLFFSMGQGRVSLLDALKTWVDEGKSWSKKGPAPGNFGQVIWKTTYLVGCGRSFAYGGGEICVCDWGPGGNVDGASPLDGGHVPAPSAPDLPPPKPIQAPAAPPAPPAPPLPAP